MIVNNQKLAIQSALMTEESRIKFNIHSYISMLNEIIYSSISIGDLNMILNDDIDKVLKKLYNNKNFNDDNNKCNKLSLIYNKEEYFNSSNPSKNKDFILNSIKNKNIKITDDEYNSASIDAEYPYTESLNVYELSFNYEGFKIYIEILHNLFINKKGSKKIIDIINLYYPISIDDETNMDFFVKNIISKIINELEINSEETEEIKEEKYNIGILSSNDNGYYIKKFDLSKKIDKIKDSDFNLHYGDGFSEFNDKLLESLKSKKSNKGLYLLYGDPGTGKSYYIKYLLHKLYSYKKPVIYIPSALIESILDPMFTDFITNYSIKNKNSIVLLIEDAEYLVCSREKYINSAISNLLNMTDGILNDIMGTQIIVTLNSDINNIDNALMRDGRLIAKKQFTKLNKDQSLKLLKHLNLDENNSIDKDMTLAEIYALKNNSNIITHNNIIKSNNKYNEEL